MSVKQPSPSTTGLGPEIELPPPPEMVPSGKPNADTDKPINLTITARSKEFRLLSRRELLKYTRELPGTLYQKGTAQEYHLIVDGLPPQYPELVIAFAEYAHQRVVITQMHKHFSYRKDGNYQRVN